MYPGDVSPSFTRIVTHIAKAHKATPTDGATLVHYQYCRWPHYSTQCSMLASAPADRHSTAWFQLAYIRTWSHHVCILCMTVHTDRFPVCTLDTYTHVYGAGRHTYVCTLYVHFKGCHGTKWLENRCNSVRTHRASLGLTPCVTHTLLNVSFSSSLHEARHVSLLRSARGSARSPLRLMNLTLWSSGCSTIAGIAA